MNQNQGYQNYPPVQGYPQQQAYPQPGYAPYGYQPQDAMAATDLSNPAVAAFTKRVYAYFASALAAATLASVGGVYATDYFLASGDVASVGTMRVGALVVFFASFIAVAFTRKAHSPLKTGLLYVFASACGVMVAPMLTYFIASGLGMTIVYAFAIATVVWVGLTVYVFTTNKDFRGLGSYLFAGILLVLGLVLLNIFVPFPNLMSRGIMAGVLVLFVGFTLYDTSRVTRDYFHANDAVGAALVLFYDFFVLFRYILYFMGGSRR